MSYRYLIITGAISGGHYYAYIKNLDSKKWNNFNDSHVAEISEDKVSEAWGGASRYGSSSSGYYSHTSTTLSSANAYMLMYRKVVLPEATGDTDSSSSSHNDDPDKDAVPAATAPAATAATAPTATATAATATTAVAVSHEHRPLDTPLGCASIPDDEMVPEYIREDIRRTEAEAAEKEKLLEEQRNRLDLKVGHH